MWWAPAHFRTLLSFPFFLPVWPRGLTSVPGNFYTKEFLEQLKRILKPDGVVASLGLGLSQHTTESNFPYIYRNIDPAVSLFVRNTAFFLSREPLSRRFESSYARIGASNPERVLYTDHRIYGLTWKSMASQTAQYFRNLGNRQSFAAR